MREGMYLSHTPFSLGVRPSRNTSLRRVVPPGHTSYSWRAPRKSRFRLLDADDDIALLILRFSGEDAAKLALVCQMLGRLVTDAAWVGETLEVPSPLLFVRDFQRPHAVRLTDEALARMRAETNEESRRRQPERIFLATADGMDRLNREFSRGSCFHRDRWRSYLAWVDRRGRAFRTIVCTEPIRDGEKSSYFTAQHLVELLRRCGNVSDCVVGGVSWRELPGVSSAPASEQSGGGGGGGGGGGHAPLLSEAVAASQSSAELLVSCAAFAEALKKERLPPGRTLVEDTVSGGRSDLEVISEELLELKLRCALVKQELEKLSLSSRDAEDASDIVQGCHAHVGTAASLRDLHNDLLGWVRGLHKVPLNQANFPALRQFWRMVTVRVTLKPKSSMWATAEAAAAAAAAAATTTPPPPQGEWLMQQRCEQVVRQVVDALPELERLRNSVGSESLAALQFMLEDDDCANRANHDHHHNGNGSGNSEITGELMRHFADASAAELNADNGPRASSAGVSVGSLLFLEHGRDDRAGSAAAAALPTFCAGRLQPPGTGSSEAGSAVAAHSTATPASYAPSPAAAPAAAADRISRLLLPGVVSEAFSVD